MTRHLLQYRAFLALFAIILAAGCADTASPVIPEPASVQALDDEEKAALDAARSRWTALGLEDYEFDIRQGCFCEPAKQTWRHVQVMDGHIVSVIPEGTTSTTLQRITEPGWWTVPELFEMALQKGTSLSGEFDLSLAYADLGYPTEIRLESKVPDGGSVIEVRNLKPLE